MSIMGRIGVGGRLAFLVFLTIAGIFAMQRFSVVSFDASAARQKEVELTHLTDLALSIVESYHQRAEAGELTEQQAQRQALSILQDLSYEGDNYFWVKDRQPVMLMHGAKPALVGRNFTGFKDPNGVLLFDEMVEGTADGTAATVSYQWAAPGAAEGDPPVDKLAVVQPFEPWGWIIGTGAYLTRLEAEHAALTTDLNLILVVLSAVLLLFAAILALSVTRPIKRLSNRMAALSSGDTETEVPYSNDKTSFGEIARALVSFRSSLIERAAMQEQEKQRAAAELERERLAEEERKEKEAAIAAAKQAAEEEKRRAQAEAQREIDARQQAEADERAARSAELQKVIDALGKALKSLADGDLRQDLNNGFPEEYEKLRRDFNEAIAAMRATIGQVVVNADSILNDTGQISTSADDLARRTEKQAATLEEAATALDQLTTYVRSSAESADNAAALSTDAKSSAERGRVVAIEAVKAMDSIKNSSQEISKITQVIDDIAFQTNLLALNAGVEAARAGEAGRGFAVVATEVGCLAQRSSEAAREISTLISNSGNQVEQGVQLVSETGDALTAILQSISDIADRIGSVATSAREQTAGIEEINTAVTELDHVTQQNAAMFEETTAASHALTQEARGLVSAVSRFSLEAGASAKVKAPQTKKSAPAPKAPLIEQRYPVQSGNAA